MTTFTASRHGLRSRALSKGGLEPSAASLLETFALSFGLAAVAGVLPLVMYLRG